MVTFSSPQSPKDRSSAVLQPSPKKIHEHLSSRDSQPSCLPCVLPIYLRSRDSSSNGDTGNGSQAAWVPRSGVALKNILHCLICPLRMNTAAPWCACHGASHIAKSCTYEDSGDMEILQGRESPHPLSAQINRPVSLTLDHKESPPGNDQWANLGS